MQKQERNFSPFKLKYQNTKDAKAAFNFIRGNINLAPKATFLYKNWAILDDKLNRQIVKIDGDLSNEALFIELFYRATEELIDYNRS